MADKQTDVRQIIETAREKFERDLLNPEFTRLTSDEEHLSRLIGLACIEDGHDYLDIGTGNGYIAFALAGQYPGISVTGLDIADKVIAADNLKACKEHLSGLRFLSFGGTALPFAGNSFHGIFCRYAFHHFPLPGESAAEMERVLEPSGFCIISDPVADDGDEPDFINRLALLKNDGHVRYWRETELTSLFESAGLIPDARFFSSITFPRELDEACEEILLETPPEVLDLYRITRKGAQVYMTVRVLNIRFRKLPSVR